MTERNDLSETAWADFEARLRPYVRRRVAPRWADDVVGDVLLRLVRHRDTLEKADDPTAWAFRVARNVIVDHHRSRAAEWRALAGAADGHESAVSDATGTDDTTEDFAECLLPFVRMLPEAYRDALTLTEFEGMTQAAAAERLGLSISGMKSRVQRGRAKLKEALLQCCSIEVDRRGGVVDYAPRAPGCRAAG